MKEFWQQCIEYLSDGLAPEQIKQWILPLKPIGFNDDETEFHISAPSILKQSWATEYYAPKIQQLIKNRFNHDVIVKVLIKKPTSTPVTTSIEPLSSSSFEQEAAELPTALMTAPTSSVTTVDAYEPIVEPEIISGIEVSIENEDDTVVVTPASLSKPVTKPLSTGISNVKTPNLEVVVKESYKFANLNPYLTFENLVVGKSNEMAHASAENVVRHVGQKGYNPLFIYGSSGLGKTHLMHAIGNELFNKHGFERVRYIHAETYYTDIAKRMRRGEWVDYRMQDMQEYEQLDLLLIDDIQFFKNKDRTQQEFFYLFDAMVTKNKQVVISSDTYPRELEEMDSRLITRFNSGLVIAIEPPELEMRVAILLKKADTHYSHLTLTDEAAFFIAKHIQSNVRELEGGLNRVVAFAQFRNQKEITVEMCKEALKDLLRVANGLITVENIQKTVADFYKIRVSDIYSKSRKASMVRARHIAMYLSKELTRQSLPDLGEAFGGRDHSTVHHAVSKIASDRLTDRQLNHELKVLEQTIKG